ncbi:MAG: caspase family protein [Nannocystaceae bacterium]
MRPEARPQTARRRRLAVGGGVVLAALAGLAPLSAAAAAPTAITPAELHGTRRIALVIGVNDGGRERARLRYAGSDAKALSKVLADLGGVTYEDRLLLDDPDVAALRRGFERIAERVRKAQAAGERVELLFYYSGHSDETGLLIGEELVDYRQLRKMIDAVPADVRIAILDSCASGAFTRLKGGKTREPFLVGGATVSGHAFLTSSSADEAAQESDRIRGSFFTHYLVTGLRGAADINHDRQVTLNEAYRFAFDETLARTEGTRGGPQHAAYEIQLAGSGDLVMTDLRQATATLELTAAIGGRVFVRDERGNLEAELHKPKGAGSIALALEPGTYRVTVDDGAALWRASVRVQDGGAVVVDTRDLKKIEAEATTSRGATPAAEPTPPPKPTLVPFNIGVTPRQSTNAKHGDARLLNHTSISFGTSDVARIEGLDVALAASTIREELRGAQLAAGVTRLMGDGVGLQGAAVLTIADGAFDGLQWSVIANTAKGDLRGAQLTSLFNYANHLRGAQLGGVANYARDIHGFQLGMVNTSGALRGASIGAVNVTRGRVDGLQLGLINFADDADASIALLPISRKGGVHLDVWTSDLAAFNLGLRLASRRTYTMIVAGIHPFGAGSGWTVGLGLGGRFTPTETLFIDLDNVVHVAQPGFKTLSSPPALIDSLRLLIGWRPHHRFSLYAGPTLNVGVDVRGAGEHFRVGYPYASYRDDWVMIWPGAALGVSI